jgi:hypothetical protein
MVEDPAQLGLRKTTTSRTDTVAGRGTAERVVAGFRTKAELGETPGTDAAVNGSRNAVACVALASRSNIAIEMSSAAK